MNLENNPLVSVIIPYYNHNMFVEKTLNSILEDTYPNKEIIIINDGSTEHDSSNLNKWIEKNSGFINIIYKKRENKGVTKTINEMIKLSSGKYIALIASDDYFINNTFSKRVNILESNPNKLMLVSDAIVVDDYGKLLFQSAMFEQRKAPKKNYFTDSGLKKEIIKRWSFVGPTSFINKKLFDIVGDYNENLLIEDWDFYLRVVSKNLILFFDEKVAAYRWHDNNISKDETKNYLRDLCACETQKINIKNFKFPYNIILWLRSKKCFKRLIDKYKK
ncbi:glycosyltransferase [Aliarcobacter cryaerophilus]|uniref:glycosyltransferase n=1 Tax=Aliarcobacter cryaerophilus TaxID=28198 RepID=UPI003DA37AE4